MKPRCFRCGAPMKYCDCTLQELIDLKEAEANDRPARYTATLQGDDALDTSLLGPSVDADKALADDWQRIVRAE